MPDPSTIGLFLVAAAALLVIPGPAVLFIVARSMSGGRRAGLVSVLGIQVGGLVHVLAAALGLSALLVSSVLAFGIVKYAGAAYLVYLGLKTLLSRPEAAEVSAPVPGSLARVFWQGALVNVLNPKTALFFFAFLPQFVNPARGPVAPQVLVLGVLFILLALCSDSLYAVLAGTVGRRLQGNTRSLSRQKYVTGGIYLALGVFTALTGHGKRTA